MLSILVNSYTNSKTKLRITTNLHRIVCPASRDTQSVLGQHRPGCAESGSGSIHSKRRNYSTRLRCVALLPLLLSAITRCVHTSMPTRTVAFPSLPFSYPLPSPDRVGDHTVIPLANIVGRNCDGIGPTSNRLRMTTVSATAHSLRGFLDRTMHYIATTPLIKSSSLNGKETSAY